MKNTATITTSTITTATESTIIDEGRFQALLDTWNKHQDMRRDGSPVAELFNSRTELDAVRLDARLALAS